MREEWKVFKDSRGTPGPSHVYEISNYGRVKKDGVIIDKHHKSGSGYKRIASNYVHKLVGEYFLDNPDNKPQVNHIDGDKSNNHVSNLEWVTFSENMKHAWRSGLHKGTTGMKFDRQPWTKDQRKRLSNSIKKWWKENKDNI